MTPNVTADVDVLVIGAGLGGLYALHSLKKAGMDVVGVEAKPDLGGVWYRNSYPGARVDLESETFCYLFDDELYRNSPWTERYAAQPEILEYLDSFADRFELRDLIRFDTRVCEVVWLEGESVHQIGFDDGSQMTAQFVVAATGQLSEPRPPDFEGLEDFEGDWCRASDWPKADFDWRGKRVGVIGTGSTGVQLTTAVASEADQLYVFQRTPNYSVPAQNQPRSDLLHETVSEGVASLREAVRTSDMGFLAPPIAGSWHDFDPWEREKLLEERWAYGGQAMLRVFSDQGTDEEANAGVAEFVRRKTRERLQGREDLEALVPRSYPIGTRRLCVDTGYYEQFLRSNVYLVDVATRGIAGFDRDGVVMDDGEKIELDVVIFALGFDAFTGSLYNMGIRGRDGLTLQEAWSAGPQALYGLMTHGFPNLFHLTGPASPSVLANMFAANVQHVDLVTQILGQVTSRGAASIEARRDSQEAWVSHAQDLAKRLIRYHIDNYFVHLNEDGSRVFIPYTGGFSQYIEFCNEELASGLPNFVLSDGTADSVGGEPDGSWRAA